MSRVRLFVVLVLALSVGSAFAAPPKTDPVFDVKRETLERAVPRLGGPTLVPKQCVIHNIACGQTVAGNLTTADCLLGDGSFVDFYQFAGQSGRTVTINLSSNAFDTFLALLDPTPEVVAVDDDSGPGTNSRIVFTLDQTSSEWAIAANSLFPGETGPYTLSLQCSGGQPPPPPPPPPPPQCPAGFFSDPSYPDFCFDVSIRPSGQAAIDGTREANCIEDTVCVSGALAGRSEVFIRIVGPRPNGFLWPTITRFTPSRVDVDIIQRSSGDSQSYTLEAVPASSDDLSGLQDRTGFLP